MRPTETETNKTSRNPECLVCLDLCCCGQRDGLHRPIHYGCQAALPDDERHPKLTKYPTSFAEQRERQWRGRQQIIEARLKQLEGRQT